MSHTFDFKKQLAFSRGVSEAEYPDAIRSLIPGCELVVEPSVEMNKLGVDYVATLRRGATVFVDVKRREKGCSQFWKRSPKSGILEPELALELWSVRPGENRLGIAGWTLDESKLTDYTFHVFDPSDTGDVFLFPFQLLRSSFVKNLKLWRKLHPPKIQSSGAWESECLFVPAGKVIDAIHAEMWRNDAALTQADNPRTSLEKGLITPEHRSDLVDRYGCVEPGTEDAIDFEEL